MVEVHLGILISIATVIALLFLGLADKQRHNEKLYSDYCKLYANYRVKSIVNNELQEKVDDLNIKVAMLKADASKPPVPKQKFCRECGTKIEK